MKTHTISLLCAVSLLAEALSSAADEPEVTIVKRGEEVLAEVKSSWCCIDTATLRPARIGADVAAFFFPRSAAAEG